MKALIVSMLMSTHMTELVPLSWALRAAGHQVLIGGDPDIAPTARGAGLHVAEIGELVALDEQSKQGLPPEMFPLDVLASRTTEDGKAWWGQGAAALVPNANAQIDHFLQLARDWKPDVVISDGMSLLGWLVGSAAGVPFVRQLTGLAPLTGPFYDTARQMLAPTCERLGLSGLAEPGFTIDPVPASLQSQDAPAADLRVRYAPYNGPGNLPDWARRRPEKRRVCVTFGSSTPMTGPRPVHNVLEALADVPDIEVVVTLSAESHKVVGPLPAWAKPVERMPLNLFLETCDLVIHHGGAGTGLTSTAFGLPQVVLPQWGTSFDFARRLAEAGAGFNFQSRTEQDDIGAIRTAIVRSLQEPAIRTAAEGIREEMRSLPPMHAAVDRIEELVG
nr:DUF1205 domain-containing protein [Streptomyces sp. NBC_00830]WTB35720.1 DUF1205 domain-containing protein [Streptomyces sp. NBC_00830]